MHCNIQSITEYAVASYVGAWIETQKAVYKIINLSSHPMWVRGLKRVLNRPDIPCFRSHPMWVRGLKPRLLSTLAIILEVASYVGAWIETCIKCGNIVIFMSHPMWVRGLKPIIMHSIKAIMSRILCGCVD